MSTFATKEEAIVDIAERLAKEEPVFAYGVCGSAKHGEAVFQTGFPGLTVSAAPAGAAAEGHAAWLRITEIDTSGLMRGAVVARTAGGKIFHTLGAGHIYLGYVRNGVSGVKRAQLTPKWICDLSGEETARENLADVERCLCAASVKQNGEQWVLDSFRRGEGFKPPAPAEAPAAVETPKPAARAEAPAAPAAVEAPKPAAPAKAPAAAEPRPFAPRESGSIRWMQKKEAVDTLDGLFRAGGSIFVYGVCYSVQDDTGMVWFQTGIRSLSLPCRRNLLAEDQARIGEGQWFRLTAVDRAKGFISGDPVSVEDGKSAFHHVKPGDLCLGYVSRQSKTGLRIQLTPKWFGGAEDPVQPANRANPEPGSPCAAVVSRVNGNIIVASVVSFSTMPNAGDRSAPDSYPSWLPETLTIDEISLLPHRVEDIRRRVKTAAVTRDTLLREIADSYCRAYREHEVIIEPGFGQHISFACANFRDALANDAPIFIGLKPDKAAGGKSWHIEFAGLRAKRIKYVFLTHVRVSDEKSMIRELADLALEESWDYGENKSDRYPILQSYFYYTYYNVWFRNQFVDSGDGTMRVFNTGLVNYRYEDIYCLLSAIHGAADAGTARRRWKFQGFAVLGEGPLGKELNRKINERDLPGGIKYITELKDLFIDTSQSINSDWEHILIDNIDRLPARMFRDEARAAELEEIDPIVGKMLSADQKTRAEGNEEMREYLQENDHYLRDIVEVLKTSVDRAWKRAEWNYKTAVPVYYAARNTISLLLPLNVLTTRDRAVSPPDVALVVSKQPSGNYQGETIFTLAMAYVDSRLITRPDSDWLRPDLVKDDTDVEDEEDDYEA